MMQETIIDMLRTFIIALLLTYMLLAAILENLTQPLMILGTVPLALIGVFSALLYYREIDEHDFDDGDCDASGNCGKQCDSTFRLCKYPGKKR